MWQWGGRLKIVKNTCTQCTLCTLYFEYVYSKKCMSTICVLLLVFTLCAVSLQLTCRMFVCIVFKLHLIQWWNYIHCIVQNWLNLQNIFPKMHVVLKKDFNEQNKLCAQTVSSLITLTNQISQTVQKSVVKFSQLIRCLPKLVNV